MIRLAVLTVFLAGAATAQDSSLKLQRNLELPSHRSMLAQAEGATLTAFETDGCSGGLSSSWRSVADLFPDFETTHSGTPPWEYCCVIHDRAYHNGGGAETAEDSYDQRQLADEELRACVVSEGQGRREELAEIYSVSPEMIDRAYDTIAQSMYLAVRFGGGPCTGLPWRWGFGYPNCLPLAR